MNMNMNINMNMNMNMSSNSSSITHGLASSFTTFPVTRTTHFLLNPNAKPHTIFSLNLSISSYILYNPTRTTLTLRSLNKPISAINSGLEASITDSKDDSVTITDAKIVAESGDENKTQLRVDLTGDQTRKIFDKMLVKLGRTAPPVPGFRMRKGGKSSKIPKDFLVQMLGEERVTKFVIQEILNSTMADYAEKENLDVKDRKISTTQTAEQLKKSFKPGTEFGFNVIIEPENSQDSS
ncbi:PREDICTED: uncharacterized protein LOC109355447 isoform X2 [Lupinus angustifolius]|uniref:uncharacterized protein LOC109355447 isoform X2 n=1 Tax=Lupinus angustifolius TaxID=3871 RepID=UPI00092F7C6B|nr:PREDICTED: uncharacterized protein LOC109355447 isoform X2 [Lupinus angustifolius]